MVSAFAGIMLGVNYPIGTIFIAIPWLFTNAGFTIATISVIGICTLYIIVGHMMLECMSRAECLTRQTEEEVKEEDSRKFEIITTPTASGTAIPTISENRSFWFVDLTSLFLPKFFTFLITISTLICL